VNRFLIPRPPVALEPLGTLPVTAFRTYLACPYRFYLRYVLRLASLDDRAIEMDAMSFGSITHEVLQSFGASDVRDETRAETIDAFLSASLDNVIRSHFGEDRRPAVRIQTEQLRQRLSAFAYRQATLASEGWRIVHTERDLDTQIELDGSPFKVTGKIDRIDRHDDLGWRIYDYKTGDTANTPEKSHHTGRGDGRVWTDLQLPLYRDLCVPLELGPDVALGYINLPKDLKKTGAALARWAAADLEQAAEARDAVIRAVREQRFWPPGDAHRYPDGYERLCGDRVMHRDELIAVSGDAGGDG
jgi:hypothetical protein